MRVIEKAAMILAVGVAMALQGCNRPAGRAGDDAGSVDSLSGEITVVGSTTVQPVAEVLAGAYEALHPGCVITVQGGGSSVGVTSAGEGTADIGSVSRDIAVDEFDQYPGLVVHAIARDGIAVVADPGVPVEGLTLDQVRGIFSGSISNWSSVGGPDMPIVVVSREEGSGTRGAFEELMLGDGVQITAAAILQASNGAILTTVSGTPGAIGYLSFGYLDPTVKALSVDGVAPTPENAANGSYTAVRPLNLVTSGDPDGLARAWIDFIYSADGQAIVVEQGYLGVSR